MNNIKLSISCHKLSIIYPPGRLPSAIAIRMKNAAFDQRNFGRPAGFGKKKLLTDCSARMESRKRLITHRLLCQDRVSKTINWKNLLLLLSSAYPSNMAPIATKLRQNAFRTIPDISFFDEKMFFETSNGRLPPEDGSDRPQTSGKRVSGDPRHFIFRRHKHFLRPKFLLQKLFSSTVRKFFQQSACFGVAVQVYIPMSNAAREFIARTIGFSLLRPLAEG